MSYPSGLGNGTGFIYLVAPNGTDIISNLRNDTTGRERVLVFGSGPKTNRTSSTQSYSSTLSITGNRIFLYDDGAAVEGVLGAATEITDLIMVRASTNAMAHIAATLAANTISLTRTSNLATVALSTEGGAPTDQLDTITYSELVNGDRLILYGPSGGQVTTVSSGTGNIFLTGGTSFVTSSSTNQLELRYWNAGGGVATGWYEIGRSVVLPTVANQRTQNVAVPVQGITNLTLPDTGTTTLEPGVHKGYYYVTGAPVLIGAVAIAPGGSPIDGDQFIVNYQATPTVGAFSVTMFGVALTATQTQQRLVIITTYSSASAAWRTVVYQNTNNLDFATTTQLATKEGVLGNPAADGYVLQSTTAGTRSWGPNPYYPTLYNTTANNATTGVIEETLKSYSVPANTLMVAGDILEVEATYTTLANANAKTATLYYGATAILTVTGNWNAQTIYMKATISVITATTQSVSAVAFVNTTASGAPNANAPIAFRTTPGETITGAVVVAAKATTAAGVGDVTNVNMSVKVQRKY